MWTFHSISCRICRLLAAAHCKVKTSLWAFHRQVTHWRAQRRRQWPPSWSRPCLWVRTWPPTPPTTATLPLLWRRATPMDTVFSRAAVSSWSCIRTALLFQRCNQLTVPDWPADSRKICDSDWAGCCRSVRRGHFYKNKKQNGVNAPLCRWLREVLSTVVSSRSDSWNHRWRSFHQSPWNSFLTCPIFFCFILRVFELYVCTNLWSSCD